MSHINLRSHDFSFLFFPSASPSPRLFLLLPQFKLPTSSPPTTKAIKVITATTTTTATPTTPPTTPTTAMTKTTTTAAAITIATTKELTTPTLSYTSTSHEPTHPGTTLPPQPPTLPPSTSPGLEVTTREEEESEASETVTHSDWEDAVATQSVTMATAELMPVTVADGLSGDLDPVVPLMIPDSSPPEVVTALPPSERQAAKEALTLAEAPTMVLPGFPPPTLFHMGEPADSEPSLYLDSTQTPTLVPPQDLHTEAGSPTADSEVPLWRKEAENYTEGAVQAENDTATFSAATVLSGDGEVDRMSQSYPPQLLNADSELDYQYDSADGFLPVSSAASILLLLLLLLLHGKGEHPPCASSF